MPSVNRDISFKARQQATFDTNDLLEKILKALQHQNKLLEAMQPVTGKLQQDVKPPAVKEQAKK